MLLRVLNEAMPMLSPTQVETSACPRRWYYKYVGNYPEQQKKAAMDGAAIDKIVSAAINSKVLPTSDGWGPVALVAVQYMQRSSAVAQVVLNGVPFGGALFGGWDRDRPMAIDCLDVWRADEPEARDEFGNPIPLIQDLKTTGNKKWVKSEETLRSDLQLLVYCRAVSLAFHARYGYYPPQIECRWCYVIRDVKKPAKYPVAFFMSQKDIDDGEALWNDRIALCLDLGLGKAANQLTQDACPKNTNRCGDYGGCAFGPKFLGVCDLSPDEIGGFLMTGTALSQEQISNLLAQNGMAAPPGQQPQMMQQQPPQQMMQQQPQMMQQQPQYAQQPQQMQQYQQPQTQQLQSPQQTIEQQQAQYAQFMAQQPQQLAHQQALAQSQMHVQQPQAQPAMQQQAPAQGGYSPEALQAMLTQQGVSASAAAAVTAPAANIDPATGKRKRGRPSKAEIAARAQAGQPTTQPGDADDADVMADAFDAIGQGFLAAAKILRGE